MMLLSVDYAAAVEVPIPVMAKQRRFAIRLIFLRKWWRVGEDYTSCRVPIRATIIDLIGAEKGIG